MLFIYQKDEHGYRNFNLLHKDKLEFPLECLKISGDGKIIVGFSESLLKDEKGNPKGTQIKGVVAREVMERWSSVSKIAASVY